MHAGVKQKMSQQQQHHHLRRLSERTELSKETNKWISSSIVARQLNRLVPFSELRSDYPAHCDGKIVACVQQL